MSNINMWEIEEELMAQGITAICGVDIVCRNIVKANRVFF